MIAIGRALAFELAAAAVLPSAPAAAQSMPGIDCNLFGPTHPCDPYLLYPFGQDLRLTIDSRDAGENTGAQPGNRPQIDSIRQLFAALRACWVPPAREDARSGMEISVRLSFNRAGNIIGQPRFTYVNRPASSEQRDVYRRAVMAALTRCTPFAFTSAMGGAIAGRPLSIRYIDNRTTRTAGV